MSYKFDFFTFFVISCVTGVIRTQPCIPDPVEAIELSEDGVLSWAASENCEGTQYIVRIETGGVLEYEYTLDALSLDVSFLTYCRPYDFIVTPIADHILGMESSVGSTIALPDDVDITIQNFTGVQIADDVLIQWRVDEDYTHCVGYYHVLSWNEDSEQPESLYIGQNGHLLEHVAQCMEYKFQITTHYNGRNGTMEEFNFTVPEKTNTPSLVELRQDTLTINTTWSLEKFYLNRCPITALYVNSTHFNETYTIEDTPDRPDVEVSITGLRANSMYYFNVTVENSAGISDPFQIGVQTLPIEPDLIS